MAKLSFLLRIAFAFLFAFLIPAAHAQGPVGSIPMDSSVITGTFPNGLRYYVRSNKKPEQKVELRLMVKVGSIVEDDDQRGLAHFMEHMNFNGTKHFEKNELVSYLQSIGVEFGADLNAYTGFDQTVYILPIPTDKPGNLDKGFQILEDWAHGALLADADIDSERGVVLEESRMGKGAEQRMLEKYLPRLVAGSKYALRLPIGKDEVLKTFPYDALKRFYKTWYRPDLMGVAVVGDIDSATAMQYLRKHFAGIPAVANPRPRIYEKINDRNKSEAMVVTDKEATNGRLLLMFPYAEKKPMKAAVDYRDKIVRELTLSMLNKRLSDLARGADSPFPMAFMGFNDLIRGYENFYCMTLFGENGPEKPLQAMVAELIRARKYGFTQDELDVASREMYAAYEKLFTERNTRDSKDIIEEYISHFLDDEPVPGIETEFAWTKGFLFGIKLEEINKLMKSITGKDKIFSLISAPEKDGVNLPKEKELQKMTERAFKQDVQPVVREKVGNKLNVPLPPPGEIISQVTNTDLGTVTYTLDNGIKVTVKYTDFKDNEVLLKGFKYGGYNNYSASDRLDVKYATELVDAMGIGSYSPSDLEKVLAGKNVSVSTSISEIKNSVSGSSTVKDIEVFFQLLYLTLTSPRLDTGLAATFRSSQKMMYTFASASPEFSYLDTTYKVLYNNNPLLVSPLPKPADFDKINVNHALAIYKSAFSFADGYKFFLVGKMDSTQVKVLITKYLGSLFRSETEQRFSDDGLRPIQGEHKFIFKKGSENKSMISGYYFGETPYSEEIAIKVRAASEVLNIKIIEELREKLSAIYSGRIGASLNRDPYPHYEVMIFLPCGPENVDTLMSALQTEINKLIEKGPDKADLDKVKTQLIEHYRTNIKENAYWLGKLESIVGDGYNPGLILKYPEIINMLSEKDVQEAAKLVFGGKNKFYSILYPDK